MPKVFDNEEIEEARKEAERDSVAAYLEKKEEIEKERKRIQKEFKNIDKNKLKLLKSLIDDVAFMSVTMRELQERISRDGTVTTYKNGEHQYGTKQSPDSQLYLQMSAKHSAAMKILLDALPKQVQPEAKDDGFDGFVMGRGD